MKRTASIALPLILVALSGPLHAQGDPASPVTVAPAATEAFEDRVRLAKEAEEDELFKTYRSRLLKRNSRHLARTMRSCIARSPKPDAKAFVLVADIRADGKADAIAVKPQNEVASCFASGFSSVAYPRPPQFPKREAFPVTMKVRVVR
jgi:hypothetical protein